MLAIAQATAATGPCIPRKSQQRHHPPPMRETQCELAGLNTCNGVCSDLLAAVEATMTHLRTILLVTFYVSMVCSRGEVEAQAPRPLDPQAAQQFASDSEKADNGDPEAAYRMGEAFESGRLGGLKDLDKALTYYRLAAGNGHQEAAERVAQIEAELGKKKKTPPTALGH